MITLTKYTKVYDREEYMDEANEGELPEPKDEDEEELDFESIEQVVDYLKDEGVYGTHEELTKQVHESLEGRHRWWDYTDEWGVFDITRYTYWIKENEQ